MSVLETLYGIWDWIKHTNWPYVSYLCCIVSAIFLFVPIDLLKYIRLDKPLLCFGQQIGLIFLISAASLLWHVIKWIWHKIIQTDIFVSVRIRRNIKRLGDGSKRALREMYQDRNSATRLSKGSAELETLSKLGFIRCGRYIESGLISCELNGLVANWFNEHKDVIASFPEPDELF